MDRYFHIAALAFACFLFSCGDDDNRSSGPNGNEPFDVVIGDSEIPYIVITTEEEIRNEPKIPANMSIYINKVEVQTNTIGIEYRGSTSFRLSDKKSYGIEVWDAAGNDADDSFFGFPEEEDWILMGHIVNIRDSWILDQTLMYHYLGYELFRDMGRYSSRTKFVEVEINGLYQGVYVFMEKLKRDNSRIDIADLNPDEITEPDITGGYILKIDKTAGGDIDFNEPPDFNNNWADDARYSEDISFRSRYDINRNELTNPPFGEPYHPQQYLETYFLYEFPKAEEIVPEQKAYIQNYVDAFETALLNDDFNTPDRTYTDYINLNSFVDFFIINEVCRNVDGYRLSTYMHKDKDGKLNMGPIWDLNIGYDTGDRIPWDDWVINYNNYVFSDPWMLPFWWNRLMEDPIFKAVVKERWTELRSGPLSTAAIHSHIDNTANSLLENGAINRNYSRWNAGFVVDYSARVQSLKDFIEYRTNWMDGEIATF